ncbi:hypothetical protein Poli38472_006564 [Pythium oligandrum]|uniref:PPM-type phosphatase domain-containing protein n=1 Tax=Pythium oligandrum TaxID=41045 RepID=A0A8K1C505_PYTOL|nr:hypothetical protein Poli38472_006564 [Pythium oligandrum]|eukprot:TMW56554.1 hypothetical protein Poli38472_006564 [Pythium oligandrum]
MRFLVRQLHAATRSAGLRARQMTQNTHNGPARLVRQTLMLGGLGLSMLAIAHVDALAATDSSFAQCDARYTPAYSGEDVGDSIGFSLPLDGERFEKIAVSSRANKFSCATYKANFPIEDKFDVQVAPNGDVYALVLDGHGGWQVSEYGRQVLINNVRDEIQHLTPKSKGKTEANPQEEGFTASKDQISSAIQRGFARTDRDLMGKVADAFKLGFGAVARCGSCALLVFVHENTLHVANAGDIRAVLGKKGRSGNQYIAVPLSDDQNAMSKVEQERLVREHAGEDNVFVCRRPDSCYVKSALQPTRALGDFALKYSEFNGPPYVNGDRSAGRHIAAPYSPPYITATPEVRTHALHADDQFVIIGSDGVWDFLTNEEAVEAVREQQMRGTPELAGRAVVEKTLQKAAARYGMSYAELLSLPPGSHRRRRHDDTTAVVVFFDQ